MNPSTAIATVLIDELIRAGVQDFVVCPGSRSGPLALAAAKAEEAGRVRLHVRIDERSAGFLALGLAKLSRTPAPVITTSGTAVANLFPAVLEAHHAEVPLLLLTADRPPELRGTGANQTTDQVHIFGNFVRWFHDFAVPTRQAGQQRMWRSLGCRAVQESRGNLLGSAGPVHLNLPLQEPLVPDAYTDGGADSVLSGAPPDQTEKTPWPEDLAGRKGDEPWLGLPSFTGDTNPHGPSISPIPKTLVVVGDLPAPRQSAEIAELAAAAGWPLLSEPFGVFPHGLESTSGSLLLSDRKWVEQHLPDRVLVAGRITLSRDIAALLGNSRVRVDIIAARGVAADPQYVANTMYDWGAVHRSHPVTNNCANQSWANQWYSAARLLADNAQKMIADSWPSGLAAAQCVLEHLPPHAVLVLGPSNLVRDVDWARNMLPRASNTTIVGNRGLAGIDGVLSTAMGVAISSRRPSVALMGDLTFLHDVGGLLRSPGEPDPNLTVIVVNDSGGGIFATLEPGKLPAEYSPAVQRVFTTPVQVNIAQTAAAYGVKYLRADSSAELAAIVGETAAGLRIVEVVIPPETAQVRSAIATGVQQALRGSGQEGVAQ